MSTPLFHPIKVVNKRHINEALLRKEGVECAYIGRPSPLGNPFKIDHTTYTREGSIEAYKKWFDKAVKEDVRVQKELSRLADIAMVKPLYLVCWCKPKACHGDIIAAYLNDLLLSKTEKDKYKQGGDESNAGGIKSLADQLTEALKRFQPNYKVVEFQWALQTDEEIPF